LVWSEGVLRLGLWAVGILGYRVGECTWKFEALVFCGLWVELELVVELEAEAVVCVLVLSSQVLYGVVGEVF
jgi:hypothetical protein